MNVINCARIINTQTNPKNIFVSGPSGEKNKKQQNTNPVGPGALEGVKSRSGLATVKDFCKKSHTRPFFYKGVQTINGS